MIFGTFFEKFTSFMQVLIDPNEFMIAQDRMFASINNVNTDLVYIIDYYYFLVYFIFYDFINI